MGLSKINKKNTPIIIIKNSYNGDKIYYTKKNNKSKFNNILSHQGFYDLEIASADVLVGNNDPSTLDVLDIGFGLGYSAQKFIDLGVRSYTCIEISDTIYVNALHWLSGLNTNTKVTILNGDWQTIMPQLSNWNNKYHVIYYGMFDEIGELDNLNQFMNVSADLSYNGTVCSVQGLSLFKGLDLKNHSKVKTNMTIPLNVYDNKFTYKLYKALNSYNYFTVYYQYYNGISWGLDPNRSNININPCIDCYPV